MSYAGTQDVIDSLGGTKNYSVGTSGTCDMDFSYIGRMIQRADDIIDAMLCDVFGTFVFGTSQYGTRGIPNLIKNASGDMAAGLCIDNLAREVNDQEKKKSVMIFGRGTETINKIAKSELCIIGWEPQHPYLPQSSSMLFSNEETIQLNGTDMTKLFWKNIVYGSGTVMQVDLDGTTQYTPDVDFKIYYADEQVKSGTNAGHIRRLGGTNIADGQYVRVIYQVLKDPVFGVRESRLWGHADSGIGQPLR